MGEEEEEKRGSRARRMGSAPGQVIVGRDRTRNSVLWTQSAAAGLLYHLDLIRFHPN